MRFSVPHALTAAAHVEGAGPTSPRRCWIIPSMPQAAALYYNVLVSSRAATIFGSPLWGGLAACGRLLIGQMPLTSSTPRLRPCRYAGQVV
jgi:hypothetical protein